ncbi:hypothetical protein C8Q76DRAFT_797384 [Earliella scabrosa]|nr:hypothetical protein C8Q76DRAFT_797384 [Earliella scabrosa]
MSSMLPVPTRPPVRLNVQAHAHVFSPSPSTTQHVTSPPEAPQNHNAAIAPRTAPRLSVAGGLWSAACTEHLRSPFAYRPLGSPGYLEPPVTLVLTLAPERDHPNPTRIVPPVTDVSMSAKVQGCLTVGSIKLSPSRTLSDRTLRTADVRPTQGCVRYQPTLT